MKWMRERDSLIAQTMAFVQTVAGSKEDAAPRAVLEPVKLEPVKLEPVKLEPAKADVDVAALDAIRNALDIAPPPGEVPRNTLHKPLYSPPPKTVPAVRPSVPSEMQTEIRSRIASFRAHQERFNRERAEYFNATLARLRASLAEAPARRSEK
jgi:hypothetical protein